MRKVIFEIAVSLDGFIEGPNGELDGLIFDDDNLAYANTFLKGVDTIFYGRVVYEKFGIPRPITALQSESEREFNTLVNGIRKYVFSRTVKHVAGNGMVIHSNLEAEVKRIRDEDGKNIWLCGGAGILQTFIALDLIDECQFVVLPRILGAGSPLCKNLAKHLKLTLIKTQNLKSGVVVLHYKPERRRIKQMHDGRSF